MTLSKRISSTVKKYFFEFLYFFIFYYITTILLLLFSTYFLKKEKLYKCVQVSIKKKAFNKLKECVYDYCTDFNV